MSRTSGEGKGTSREAITVHESSLFKELRLRQGRDPQGGVALGRVQYPRGERLVDLAQDRGEADLRHVAVR